MDEPPATRRSLIIKLRDPADTAAWREFVAIYEPLIYRLARRKGLQDADAHDLCQEVFRALAAGRRTLGPDPRQLPRMAVTDRPQPADQLPHATAVPTPRQRGHQRPGTPRGPAGRRLRPPRPSSRPSTGGSCSDGLRKRSAASSRRQPGKPSGRPRSRAARRTRSRPSCVCQSGPSTSPGAGSWPA